MTDFWRDSWRQLFSSQKSPAEFSQWLESRYRAIGYKDPEALSLAAIQVMEACLRVQFGRLPANRLLLQKQQHRGSKMPHMSIQNRDASAPTPLKLEYSEDDDDDDKNNNAAGGTFSPPATKMAKLAESGGNDDDDEIDIFDSDEMQDDNKVAFLAEKADASAALFEFLSSPDVSPSQSLASSQEREVPLPVPEVVVTLNETLEEAKEDIVKRSRKRKRADWKVALSDLEERYQIQPRQLAFMTMKPRAQNRIEGARLFEDAVSRTAMALYHGMNLFMIEKWIKGDPIRLFDPIFCDWYHLTGMLSFITKALTAPDRRQQLDQLYQLSESVGRYSTVTKMLAKAGNLMDWYTTELKDAPHHAAAQFLKRRFEFFNQQIQQRDIPTVLSDYIKNMMRLFFDIFRPVCSIMMWRATEETSRAIWETSQLEANSLRILRAYNLVKQDPSLLGRLSSYYRFAAWWLLTRQIPLSAKDESSLDEEEEHQQMGDATVGERDQMMQQFCELCTLKPSNQRYSEDFSTLEYYKEARDAAYIKAATASSMTDDEKIPGYAISAVQKWRLFGCPTIRQYGQPMMTLFVYGRIGSDSINEVKPRAASIASLILTEAGSALALLKKEFNDKNPMPAEIKTQLKNAVAKEVVMADPEILKAISTAGDAEDQTRILKYQEKFAKLVFKQVLADVIDV